MTVSHKAIRYVLTLTLAAGGFMLHADVAHAASCDGREAAEMVRLRNESKGQAGKNQHAAVLRNFKVMLTLADQKCAITADDYRLAAISARAVGDIGNAILWFEAGADTVNAGDLKARFGQVAIKEKAGDLVKDGGLPFLPDERASLESGTAAVKASGKFTGYLPIGKYTLGGKSFEVKVSVVTKV